MTVTYEIRRSDPRVLDQDVTAPVGVTNLRLLTWFGQMAALCKPDQVHWVDGSEEEYDRLCDQMVAARSLTCRGGPAERLARVWQDREQADDFEGYGGEAVACRERASVVL